MILVGFRVGTCRKEAIKSKNESRSAIVTLLKRPKISFTPNKTHIIFKGSLVVTWFYISFHRSVSWRE